jgi:DNA-binding NarL/FixJ family response regulator
MGHMVLVSQASGGKEAIQQYREHQPDVTLMDLRMPDLSGIDALLAIRAEFPEARITMLTTFEGDVEVRRALEAGACAFLLKSIPPSELLQVIRRVHARK